MRVAVISDIHGNLHALEAVLSELEDEQPDELWCLGDLVGYGPQPNPPSWAYLWLENHPTLAQRLAMVEQFATRDRQKGPQAGS